MVSWSLVCILAILSMVTGDPVEKFSKKCQDVYSKGFKDCKKGMF